MSAPLRLVLFDVDGTLVDSQASIIAAMTAAFGSAGLAVPEPARILSIVGLSLDRAMAQLKPDQDEDVHDALVAAYKEAFRTQRLADAAGHLAPLYPGARAALDHLAGAEGILLGVATGKSRRGLDALIEMHGLTGVFVTRQVADDHPSKPHPAMILTAMAETGCAARDTVMIGDTSYDMDMARSAGVAGLGVSWGYHAAADLRGRAQDMIDDFAALPAALDRIWATAT